MKETGGVCTGQLTKVIGDVKIQRVRTRGVELK